MSILLAALQDFAIRGVAYVTLPFDSVEAHMMGNSSVANKTNIKNSGISRRVENRSITYSYIMKEFQGTEERPSKDRIIQSSSHCTARTMRNGEVKDGNTTYVMPLERQPGKTSIVELPKPLESSANPSLYIT